MTVNKFTTLFLLGLLAAVVFIYLPSIGISPTELWAMIWR